ncbi:phosphoribulokinase [Microbulbifer sp. 2205BS26-8]|uniref:phosphoribulokinase n=1 Tax=Microbulbifer sp. 2205BS26-8 TaxID=3064386 RepID=UPI00273EABAC|nr:phosphoribulokinase [Microbulbifer sp. 2205BS26-8]MDP5209432.1 phosphoribulokinase [Microbulbifer sp. 2205BS26-8]
MVNAWPRQLIAHSQKLAGKLPGEVIEGFIRQHRLPAVFHRVVRDHYLPLTLWLRERHRPGKTLIVGISGGQGTGKSTLTDFLQIVLTELGNHCCTLSLDDLYLTRAERQQLARGIHPLLLTRGVPGTHDVQLGIDTLNALCRAGAQSVTPLPRFDKSLDERVPRAAWPQHTGPVDIVLLEGWCLGAKPSLNPVFPLNALEQSEDASGTWRHFINWQLAGPYRDLFALPEVIVMLKAPSMESILEWRKLQEQKLREQTGGKGLQDRELLRFVQHYERITRNLIAEMPEWADCVFLLGEDHRIEAVRLRH